MPANHCQCARAQQRATRDSLAAIVNENQKALNCVCSAVAYFSLYPAVRAGFNKHLLVRVRSTVRWLKTTHSRTQYGCGGGGGGGDRL